MIPESITAVVVAIHDKDNGLILGSSWRTNQINPSPSNVVPVTEMIGPSSPEAWRSHAVVVCFKGVAIDVVWFGSIGCLRMMPLETLVDESPIDKVRNTPEPGQYFITKIPPLKQGKI